MIQRTCDDTEQAKEIQGQTVMRYPECDPGTKQKKDIMEKLMKSE